MNFEIWRAPNGEWFFRIVARNGRVLCHSEGYKRKESAQRTADSIIGTCSSWGAKVVVLEKPPVPK